VEADQLEVEAGVEEEGFRHGWLSFLSNQAGEKNI